MADLEPTLEPTRLKRFRDVSFFRKPLEPSSTQISDESNSISNSRWQPKVTIYRLLVISTTIALGSAKAVAVFYGKSYVSTTIEWIAGVVVSTALSSPVLLIFIIAHLTNIPVFLQHRFFVIGWLEGNPSQYPKLAWLVDCDLIRLIWISFKRTPGYTSEERPPIPEPDGAHPPITGYRLLVSGNVLIFGMVKAYLSYVGLGGAANALDWTFGVIVTSM